MNILILGATGFIGSAIARKLVNDGHRVTGLGRDPSRVALKMPALHWIRADLAGMTRSNDWQDALKGHDVVVNCAGALQDGLSDDLVATQEKAMLALYDAARDSGLRLVVQISAETEGTGQDLAFLATKRRANAALASSGLRFVILRPALVLGRNAHGGSALLRALAALPFAIPLIHAENPVATIALDDVASTVSAAVDGELAAGSDLPLGNDESLTLKELVLIHRRWLGLPPVPAMALPSALTRPVTWLADVAGRLGWRSPLRSTAMTVMSGGIASRQSADFKPRLLRAAETLAAAPSGVQDLWFARLYLLKPLIVVALSLFWLASGLVPFFAFDAASIHFAAFLPTPLASAATIATCLADIALGLAVLVRPWARPALLGMLLLTLAYLLAATLAEPALWLDPLGPLVKVLPSIPLTLTALAILDER
ncbi:MULTISPECIES: SDR family oxidoreductase [unclassified Sinorhizobium]|uniref:SDR family oxidoreductase n=1 Tax=unclassified Sinorhizobium TaxID=2613772 RepID=UPI0024C2CD71|nr:MULTISPECIES: SDR family oxidoreductase [unclassified Sinorhizobium]MDK1378367.1 SDR family oxidoreductase [Sinorhizobium sp. 6-70]MDK1482086.1 SDR family oxidoreductase [Sinorhizobium sp. 6-117]